MKYFILDGNFKEDCPQGPAFKEAVEEYCANDPFVKAGVQEYTIKEFNLFAIQDYAKEWK